MPSEFPLFESLSVSLSLSQIIWGIYFLTVLFVTIYTVIFYYHWNKYSIGSNTLSFFTTIVYMAGTALLLIVMTLALIQYSI